jgi:hypothetical protein
MQKNSSTNLVSNPQIDTFAPYRTGIGTMDYGAIHAWCHTVAEANKSFGVTNPFGIYERLLDVLAAPQFEIVPLRQLMENGDSTRVRVSLRHDLDANLLPSGRAAAALCSRGMVGSFYPLHTSYYWAEVRDGVFCRHPGMNEVIGAIAEHGQEIGLHIDPLHVYFAHGVDGTEAVLTELAWLRSVTGNVTGLVAHNSAPVYGAENFECLKGLALGGRVSLTWQGKTVPLQTVGWTENGLAYEGNHAAQPDTDDSGALSSYLANVPPDALRRSDWQSIYLLHNPFFSRSNDVSVWLIGRDRWVVAEHRPVKRLLSNIDTLSTFEWLRKVSAGKRVVIVIHPEYIGEL